MKMSKIIGLVGAIALMISAVGQANAAYPPFNLRDAKVRFEDPTLGGVPTTVTIDFKQNETTPIQGMKFQFCKTASGTCDKPTGMTTADGVTLSAVSMAGGADSKASWTPTFNDGNITITNAAQIALASMDTVSVTFAGINNGSETFANTGCSVANNGTADTSATCYVRITTYSAVTMVEAIDASDERIGNTTGTYTLTKGVTVSARVDPTFTFTVTGVNSGTANVGGTGLTTDVTTTYNAIPFGNLTANDEKYASQQLKVVTNTQGGYSVEARLVGGDLDGVYAGNNIDPFVGTGGGVTWSTPIAWQEPNGAANSNSGFIGMNTTDTDVTGWGTVGANFGPITNTPQTVMTKALGGDNGAAPIYVTFAIEAGIYQPADTYTGTIVYNALPTY